MSSPLRISACIADWPLRLITNPRRTLPSLPGRKLNAASNSAAPVLVPSISMRWTELSPSPGPFEFGLEPGCVKPSIVTVAVICGYALAGVIVWTPAPEMSNAIVEPELALAYVIASRRVHVPVPVVAHAFDESPASLTVTVAPGAKRADVTNRNAMAAGTADIVRMRVPDLEGARVAGPRCPIL